MSMAEYDDMGYDSEDIRELRRKESVTRHKGKIERAAKRYGWRLEQEQGNIGLLIFVKTLPGFDDAQINVYTTKMTVTTILWHPKRGKGSMYRLNVPFHMLAAIFENPRVHSSKFNHAGGYFPRKASTQMPKEFYGI